MTAKHSPKTVGKAGASRLVSLREEDVKRLQQALENAAEALHKVEALLADVAPLNAMTAEKLAEEYERTAKAIRDGQIAATVAPTASTP